MVLKKHKVVIMIICVWVYELGLRGLYCCVFGVLLCIYLSCRWKNSPLLEISVITSGCHLTSIPYYTCACMHYGITQIFFCCCCCPPTLKIFIIWVWRYFILFIIILGTTYKLSYVFLSLLSGLCSYWHCFNCSGIWLKSFYLFQLVVHFSAITFIPLSGEANNIDNLVPVEYVLAYR